jgi:hypothetical protein
MRSNINALKNKYGIPTDKGLLNFLADKEMMPVIPEVKIKKEKVTKDKPELIIPEELFSSIKLDIK